MMKPILGKSTSFNIISSTMKIELLHDDGVRNSGTGFVFDFSSEGDPRRMVLVTNAHIVCSAHNQVSVHYATACNGKRIHRPYVFTNLKDMAVLHPVAEVDLAAIPLAPLFEELNDEESLDHMAFVRDNIPTDTFIDDLDAIERVLMVGYPAGLADESHCLPITRAGITATPYAYDYADGGNDPSGPSDFALDIAGFKGSSGSPIILDDTDKVVLLGVQKQMRMERMTTYIRKDTEALLCDHPIHMAICVKSREILELGKWLDNPAEANRLRENGASTPNKDL